MAIKSSQPRPIRNPNIPFDQWAVHLVLAAVVRPRDVPCAATLTAQSYRTLPDGTNERGPDVEYRTFADVFAEADPVLSRVQQAAANVRAAIEAWKTEVARVASATPEQRALAAAVVPMDAAIQAFIELAGI